MGRTNLRLEFRPKYLFASFRSSPASFCFGQQLLLSQIRGPLYLIGAGTKTNPATKAGFVLNQVKLNTG
jgi:hypothetical protein